jgi:group I intron endonuclease
MRLYKNIPQSGVYKIVNIIDGKVYIGGTRHLYRRKQYHWSMLRGNVHQNKKLQTAWNIYGQSAFRFEVIQTLGYESEIKEVEQKYLDEYKSYNPQYGYNSAPFSDSNIGVHRSEECKRRDGELTRIRNLNASPETHKRWSAAQKLRMNTPEGRESARRLGFANRRITDEQIDEMIEMRKSGISNKEIYLKFKVNESYYCDSHRVKGRIAEKERNVYVKA